MKIILNDKNCEVAEGCNLSAFIAGQGLQPEGIAVAINYMVIPKKDWDTTILKENQEIMIIRAVSGG